MAKTDQEIHKNMRQQFTQEQVAMAAQAIKNAEDVVCKNCGHKIFMEGFKLKRLSRLLTGDVEDRVLPVPSVVCLKCQTELNLEEQKEEKKEIIELDFRNKKE